MNDSDGEDHELMPAGFDDEIASSDSTEMEPIDNNVPSSPDERSPIEDGEPSEIESGEESAPGNFITISSLSVDEDLSSEWSDFITPGGHDSSETYEIQVGSDGTKKMKLRHAGSLSAIQQPLEKPMGTIIPTLHLSASHLRLFDANSPHEASVYCSDILSLQWPMYYTTHRTIDRLNMTQYIPELGIVVIATQIGRVAICSLTRKRLKGPYGLRVDWILPFDAQEKSGERPLAPLLGIAVGPVQGHQMSRSSSASDDEDETEWTWLRDRVDEDGVSITFDPDVLPLRRNTNGATHDSKPHPAHRPGGVESRDKGPSPGSQRPRIPPAQSQLVRHAWPSRSEVQDGSTTNAPVPDEPWRGLGYSRRYRLMLTYADHSVLTYELAREVPYVGDPGEGRVNWRNREGGC